MYRVSIVSVLVCVVLIVSVTVISSSTPFASEPEIDKAYLPGQRLPSFWQCDCENYYNGILSCTRLYHDQQIHIVYDLRRGVISQSTWPIQGKAIGDLILAWGRPTGTQYDPKTHNFKVYWANEAAWATAGQFGPNSEVDFITYTQKMELSTPWAGFTVAYHAGG